MSKININGKDQIMNNFLIVIDMQNDFIDGALGTKEAVKIVSNVENKIKNFDGEVVFTRDTHHDNYMNTNEGKNLPVPHCIYGTHGWQICDTLSKYATGKVFDKPTFGSVELADWLFKKNTENKIDNITLIGLCTDICVISNAMLIKAYLPETNISVDSACCAGVSIDSHNNALDAMKLCHINVF